MKSVRAWKAMTSLYMTTPITALSIDINQHVMCLHAARSSALGFASRNRTLMLNNQGLSADSSIPGTDCRRVSVALHPGRQFLFNGGSGFFAGVCGPILNRRGPAMDTRRSFILLRNVTILPNYRQIQIGSTRANISYNMRANDNVRTKERLSARCGNLLSRLMALHGLRSSD